MHATIIINGKEIPLELTPKVIKQIADATLPITERVKTFADALAFIEAPFGSIDLTGTPDEIAYKKLKIIATVLNEGWKPDWSDTNQPKYLPYFKANKTGFGFSYSHTISWYAHSTVGARLYFKTKELAEYAGKQFEAIYNDYLLY